MLFDYENKVRALLLQAGVTLNGKRPFDPVVHDASAYHKAMLWGSMGLGDSYTEGLWDCAQLDEFFYRVVKADLEPAIGKWADTALSLRDRFINLQSIRRALQVAERHYDLGNSLYEKMLGESMGYSSGYYADGATDLEGAQYAKFDLICKKMRLQKGMRVLEIGCGWGTFAEYAAKEYGVEVVGVTVSKEQLDYAEARCAGLAVSFYFGDYRTLPATYKNSFDRVISIEMVEAVGQRNFRAYMEVAASVLKKNGEFLVQAIIGDGVADAWISTRIFPNGVLPTLPQLYEAVVGIFRVENVHHFGADYDRTLMEWEKRFRENWQEIQLCKDEQGRALYDAKFYRMWRYYLLVCAGLFRAGQTDVCQLHLIKE